MKNVRSKKKLTLDSETIRHLRAIATSQLVRARGGGVKVVDSGGTCTEWSQCLDDGGGG
jgi:hypothetical protein